MNPAELISNTCFITTEASRSIAYYSHLIPIFFTLSLSFLVYFKAKKSILSKIFLAFATVFSFWLLGDLVTWTSNDYHLIYASWSLLVYFETVFFILGLYFVLVFSRKKDLPFFPKLGLFLATLPPLFITITGNSVTGFYQPVCEAFNNYFLDQYKLYLEILILFIIIFYIFLPLFRKTSAHFQKSNFIVLGSMFLFLAVFSVAEYLAASTGYYELHLYSLFIIPVFLIAIIYSIFTLDIFNIRVVSTYFLVFGFLILIASQFLFVTGQTDSLLTLLTLILSASLALVLLKNLRKESEQRIHIEKLNEELNSLLKQRESLVHLVTHKVKGSFTRSKYIFAGILDGTFGEASEEVKRRAAQGLDSDNTGIQTVDLVLNAANLQTGAVKYEKKPVDLKEIINKVVEEKKISADSKNLKIEKEVGEGDFTITGDPFWLKEAINNLVENAIRYTKAGQVTVGLRKDGGKIIIFVKDTGVGLGEEDKKILFTEGGRGKDSLKMNVDSTGYGLYSVKLIVDAHQGRVWAESGGPGQGSQFCIEL